MSSRGRRLLSEEEIEVWRKVAQTVLPRSGAMLPVRRSVPAAADPGAAATLPVHKPEPKRRTSFVPSYTPPPQPTARQPPLAPFEKRYKQRVTHGRVEIEGVMDLHGMTQAEAHGALAHFLRSAQQNGARLVLVVTGKGRPRVAAPAGHEAEPGVLRRAVPNWLRSAELRSVVIGFEEAGQPHGGLGALYIRLRRRDG